MSSDSDYAEQVREVFTWPGRVLSETGSLLLRNAKTCRLSPAAVMGGLALTQVGFISGIAGEGVALGVIGISSLCMWAFESRESNPLQSDRSFIESERRKEKFEAGHFHVGICGQSGSGKSSVVNALRGIKNSDPEAAKTGTTETTTGRTTYNAHQNMPGIALHDIPGGGTRRTPAARYYDNQKLFLFDLLLVVHSTRLGEIDIDVVKACICNKQPFLIVRAQSDTAIRNISDDDGLDSEAAKTRHINTALATLRTEFERAGIPRSNVDDMVKYCILINKDGLRRCVLGEAQSVINELDLVRFLSGIAAGFEEANDG